MEETFNTLLIGRSHAHVEIVTLNRPESANALNTELGLDLVAYFEALAMNSGDVRCVILTGSGNRHFCAGGDLKERKGMSIEAWGAQHLVFERMARALIHCPVPIIAAVNGAAFGGGCEIAAACDFIHAADSARFALTEVTLGIIPGAGGTQTLPRAIGIRRAKELILTGKIFSAEEAARWGLVNEIHAPEQLLAGAMAVATRIAGNAPLSVRQAKQSMSRGAEMSLSDAMAFEIEAYNRLVSTDDRIEGIEAFNQKRPAIYKGR